VDRLAPAGGPEPLSNLIKVLGAEPLVRMPWEVGRLTPFQTRLLLAERDKRGQVLLDGPLGEEPAEVPWERELRDHYRRLGFSDPDAIRRMTDHGPPPESPG
jgi:hypothetical protein